MSRMKNTLMKKLLCLFVMLLLICGADLPWSETEVMASEPNITMAVHFLDVGQGLSILVQSDGQNLLYDGGDRSHSSFVVSYLQQQQVTNIDYLISSHYDEDHVSGLIGCLNTFSVSTVIGADYVHDSSLYDSFMDAVSAKGLDVLHPQPGETFSFGTGNFTVLSPAEISENSNDNSVAIKLTNGSSHFIFTGDAEHSSETAMIHSGIDLDCDVLCIGHHGSASSTSWDFLQATVPEYAVISCGSDNQYGHPDADTMEKLSSMEISVFRTDKQGTVIALSDGSSLFWTADPCNDYSSGNAEDAGTLPGSALPAEAEAASVEEAPQTGMVWLSATGEKYHSIPNCGRMDPSKARQVTEADAIAQGYDACSKCF